MSGWGDHMKPVILGTIAIVVAMFVDQATKAWIVVNAESLSQGYPVFPGFNLIYLRNNGVTFGFLRQAPWWGLSALAIGVCACLAVLLSRSSSRIEALAYGAIIGGAIGNVIDRLRYRAVTDFFDFYAGSLHWPAFNFADAFIVCGVALLIAAPHLTKNDNG